MVKNIMIVYINFIFIKLKQVKVVIIDNIIIGSRIILNVLVKVGYLIFALVVKVFNNFISVNDKRIIFSSIMFKVIIINCVQKFIFGLIINSIKMSIKRYNVRLSLINGLFCK